MNLCFPVLFARNRCDFNAYRTHYSLVNLAKQRPTCSRSADQLQQLVGEQGHHAKHEVQPDFPGSLALRRLPAKSLCGPTDKFLDLEHFQDTD